MSREGEKMANNTTAVQILGARYYVYLLLQSVFGVEPSEQQRGALLAPAAQEALKLAGAGADYLAAVDEFLAFVADNDDIDAWGNDFTRLFVGPGKLLAAPWESVYVNDEPLLLVESTIDVRKAYLNQGYAPKLFPHVADDHVSLELDFMKRLSANACEALEGGNRDSALDYLKASKAFLAEHLQKWVKRFGGEVAAGAPGYYERAACVLVAYVSGDEATMDSLVFGE